jgi:hypothetical protein
MSIEKASFLSFPKKQFGGFLEQKSFLPNEHIFA